MGPASAIVLAAAVLIAAVVDEPIAGLPPWEAAVVTSLFGIALAMAGWIVNEFRHSVAEGLRATFLWSLVYAVLVAAYYRQDVIATAFDRLIGEVATGRTVVSPAGEVVAARRADGSFTLNGRVNDRDTRFIFDTGASTVVLTAEVAAAAGFHPDSLSYTIPVATANGRTLAAPVTIDSLSIGPIVESRIRALVARPGVLRDNLLGMTFLERLTSYEVRGNRLILRPKAG
jgi:aspartyl protease family protein